MRVADAPGGKFSLDLGIEIDGARHPLLPILLRLRERGGIAAARIVDGEVVTSLDDGRILKLPEERIARLLAVMDDLIDGRRPIDGEALVLDAGEAPGRARPGGPASPRAGRMARAIAAHVARFRNVADIPDVPVPPSFTASLRPYQQQGVNWLQHLREDGLGGLLADDMGLGKTAQTIAHIAIEEAAGRLDRPALVVVPTSLVPNWTAEACPVRAAPARRRAARPRSPRAAARTRRRAHRDHDLRGVGARHRGDGANSPGTWWCWTRRRRSRVPTAKATHAVVPARHAASAVPVRHADREQPR